MSDEQLRNGAGIAMTRREALTAAMALMGALAVPGLLVGCTPDGPGGGSAPPASAQDDQALLEDIIRGELLTARGVYGFFPANSVGDDIELYRGQERRDVQARFHTLRQQMEKPADQYNLALADFIAPKESRRADYIGAFAVTAGIGVEALCAKYEKDHDDYNSIMTKALADRLAEAFAEWLHKQVRGEWGYGKADTLTLEDMIRERYRGIRPAPGYPACPDHTEKRTLFDLFELIAPLLDLGQSPGPFIFQQFDDAD